MGVHGLWKILDPSGKAIPLEALENKVLAVDISIWLYQLVKGFQEAAGHSVANAYLLGLFHRICKLLFYRIRPIFVFDGGVPALKRRTIADRQSSRSKAAKQGEKLRQTLLENLAKQEALGQALGESVFIPKLFQPKKDNLFELPPLPEDSSIEHVLTDSGSSDSEEDVKLVKFKYKDIHSIDITSDEFRSLPADMRHDILTELKETRKQNSWAKIHLMPKESDNFSDYQMKRLLKRRAVQVGIEEAEGEMGTRGFTLADLENILTDQGVQLAQRIAADNKTKLLYNNKIKNLEAGPSGTSKLSTKTINKIKANVDSASSDSETEDDPSFLSVAEDAIDEDISQSEILQLIKQEKREPSIQYSGAPVEESLKTKECSKELMAPVNDQGAVETLKMKDKEAEVERGSLPQASRHQDGSEVSVDGMKSEGKAPDEVQQMEAGFQGSFSKSILPCKRKLEDNEAIKKLKTDKVPKSIKLDILSQLKEEFSNLEKTVEMEISPEKLHHMPRTDSGSFVKRLNQHISEKLKIENVQLPKNQIDSLVGCKRKADSSIERHDNKKFQIDSTVFKSPPEIGNNEIRTEKPPVCFLEEAKSNNIERELMAISKTSNELSETVSTSITQSNLSTDESDDDLVEVESTSDSKATEKSQNESEIKLDSSTKVASPASSSSSDNEFIEVGDISADEETKVIDKISVIETNIPHESITSQKPLEIIVNSTDTLEDDLFADIFESTPKPIEQPTSTKEIFKRPLESSEIKLPNKESEKIEFNKPEQKPNEIKNQSQQLRVDKESNGAVAIPSSSGESDTSPSKVPSLETIEDIEYFVSSTQEKQEPPSAVPQLSVEEIMKMKQALEKESSYLIAETHREDKVASTITEQIRIDAQELLHIFGIPYLIAPMEAEAQCAYLDLTGQTQGTITDDSDVWLFGGKNVYKNFFDQKKFVQQFKSTDIARFLHLERDEMIMLALLSGSDYTLGIAGVGAVTALEIVAHYPKNQNQQSPGERLNRFAREFKAKSIGGNIAKKLKKAEIAEGFPSAEVINAYIDPEVDKSEEKFSWSKPNLGEIRRYAREKFGWDSSKTDKIIEPILDNLQKPQTQGTLHSFFEWSFDQAEVARSKRVENAINMLKGGNLPSEPGPSNPHHVKENPKPRPKKEPSEPPVKSKTPAQIAREKAAKKFKELKKQGKVESKSNKSNKKL